MADTERHVKRFVFGRLLPVRGVDHVWERRYGWHWVVEKTCYELMADDTWVATEWLNESKPKKGWTGAAPEWPPIQWGYQPKRDGRESDPPGAD